MDDENDELLFAVDVLCRSLLGLVRFAVFRMRWVIELYVGLIDHQI
jgi:hypothetical protein